MLEAPRTERAPAEPGRALRPAAIGAVGMAVPGRVVANGPIAARFGIDPEWIVERTGVRERRVLGDGETCWACDRGRRARRSRLTARARRHLDQVLVATMSHDRLTPNLAPLVADGLGTQGRRARRRRRLHGLRRRPRDGGRPGRGRPRRGRPRRRRRAADTLTDHDDRATAALFGDGAGRQWSAPPRAPGFGPLVLGSDGARAEVVRAERSEALIRMKGQDTFREAVNRMAEATLAAAAAAGLALADIDLFVYHQANAANPAERSRSGSTWTRTACSSASRATATPRRRQSRSRSRRRSRRSGSGPGDQVLLAAFGGGLTWGATVLEWEAPMALSATAGPRAARSSPAPRAASAPPPPARWRPTAGRSASTTARTPSSAEALASEIAAAGGTAVPLAGDICDGDELERIFQRWRPSTAPCWSWSTTPGSATTASPPARRRRLGSRRGHQPLGRLPRDAPRASPHAARPLRPDRQRRFDRRAARQRGPGELRRGEGRA